jgi:hypothetical protein
VYFSLRNDDSDLVIRAKRKQGTGASNIIELIPKEKLEEDLPAVLIEGHAHWLDLSTSVVEICPLDSLWETSSENWKLDCTPGQYRMKKGNGFLVNIGSQSWDMVSTLLMPFDTPQNLLVSVSPINSSQLTSSLRLSVILPRYGLSFYVDEDGDLQSYDIRGMVYDEDQSVGSLFGLVNRLVLRPKIRDDHIVALIPRCVLIPEGEISFKMDGHHVRVEIDTYRPALGRVTYETYRVDTDMGCLTGNVSLTNKLYCAYLHALTSGCSTDPLTGRLGTEEALSLLRSASCWSIMRFGSREAELLSLIASICPTRTWYPKHLKRMQTVAWLNLPASAQHHDLYIVSKAIKEHYEKVQLFHESPSSPLFQTFPLHDDHLLQRSARRAAYLFPSEYSRQRSPIIPPATLYPSSPYPPSSPYLRPTTPQGVHFDDSYWNPPLRTRRPSWHGEMPPSPFHSAPSTPDTRRRSFGGGFRPWEPASPWASTSSRFQIHPLLIGESTGENLDVRYSARDLVEVTSGEQRAYTAATTVHRRTVNAMATINILKMVESWSGKVSGGASLSLQYDRSWLAPDFPSIWLKTYKLLRRNDEAKWFQLLFSLPAMAYASSKLDNLVPVFVAFASDPDFRLENPPHHDSYTLAVGYRPNPATLRRYVSDCARSFEQSSESTEYARTGEKLESLLKRRLKMYNDRRDADTNATVHLLSNAWPCETPPQCSLNPDLYNVPDFTSKVQTHFSCCYRNAELKEHLIRVQNILDNISSQGFPTQTLHYSFQPSQSIPSRIPWSLTVDRLFARAAPSLQAHDSFPPYAADDRNTSFSNSAPLHQLIAAAEVNAVNQFQRQYASALRTSAECFGSEISLEARGATKLPAVETLVAHYARCSASYIEGLDFVKRHLAPSSQSEQALEQSGQWPRITAHALFRSLASNSPITLSDDWVECLTRLTLLALELQRARRLLRLYFDDLHDELRRELQNEGCDGWNAEAHPDWLLIQVCFSCDGCISQLMPCPSLTSAAMQLFGSSRSG